MKRLMCIVFSVALLCVACTDTNVEQATGIQIDPSIETVAVSEIDQSFDSLAETIDSLTNITLDNAVVKTDTSNIEKLYSFQEHFASRLNNKDAYEEFLKVYQYIFPESDMDMDCLFYYGENSYNDDDHYLNKVTDYQDAIMDDAEDVLYFHYDESQKYSAEQGGVLLSATSPVGNDLSRFSRGELRKLVGCGLEVVYIPTEPIAICSPDSAETYLLCDGVECAICDAVDMFENYVNSIPVTDEGCEQTSIEVSYVNVYSIDDETYAYQMILTKSYQSVMFDSTCAGSFNDYGTDDYVMLLAQGFVANSYDVDYADFSNRLMRVSEQKEIEKIMTAGEAVRIASEQLTDNVTFELQQMDLVYCQKEAEGSDASSPESYCYDVAPSWKMYLYNANDDKTYICYVDAGTALNFRYQTVSGSALIGE